MGQKWNTEKFIAAAQVVHGDKYCYDRVVFKTIKDKVAVICSLHGEFLAKPYPHLQGVECLLCSRIKRSEVRRMTQDEFVEKAKQVHGNDFDYSLVVYVSTNEKVKIICNKCKSVAIKYPSNHLAGYGCKFCSKFYDKEDRELAQKQFIIRANKIHNNAYDYSNVKFFKQRVQVEIICKQHGSFKQTPDSHLQGRGCIKCGFISSGNKKRLPLTEFLVRANKTHGDKYDYSLVNYIGDSIKVQIICPINNHKIFTQAPFAHWNGAGCPKCSCFISRSEIAWLDDLGIPNNFLHRHVKIDVGFNFFIVDGYDPKTKTIYEFNGDYWHGNPAIYKSTDINKMNKLSFGDLLEKTEAKRNKLESAGYTVISIWESDYKKQKSA